MCPNGLAGGCELNLLCAKLGLKCGENRNFQAATKLKGRQGQNFCSSTGSISKLAARCKIARDVLASLTLSIFARLTATSWNLKTGSTFIQSLGIVKLNSTGFEGFFRSF